MKTTRTAKSLVVVATMALMAMMLGTAPAAAQVNYPGLENPGISITLVAPAGPPDNGTFSVGGFASLLNFAQLIGDDNQRPAEFDVRYQRRAGFLGQCGTPGGPVDVQMTTAAGVPVGNAFRVDSTSFRDPNTPAAWLNYARGVVASHTPTLQLGEVITVSMGPGCNSYSVPVLAPSDPGVGLMIDTDLNVTMSNVNNWGCGGFDVYEMRVFDAEGNQIGLGGDVPFDVSQWLAEVSLDLQNHVPALQPAEPVYFVWSGECDFPNSSQTALVGGLPLIATSVNPVTDAATSKPALVLAGFALATAAAVGIRRLKA